MARDDCQAMPLPALVGRLRAVVAGSDKVPKVLHARYGKSRNLEMKLRRRRSEADGSDERAREEYRERIHSTI